MCTPATDGERRSSADCPALATDLVVAAAAHPSNKIIIAGADRVDMMIDLLRRGFRDVACQAATCGPHARAGQADIVIAPDIRSEAELQTVLRRFGSALRPHGVLVMREAIAARGDNRLRQIVLEAGFAGVARIPADAGSGRIWCAYRAPLATAWAA